MDGNMLWFSGLLLGVGSRGTAGKTGLGSAPCSAPSSSGVLMPTVPLSHYMMRNPPSGVTMGLKEAACESLYHLVARWEQKTRRLSKAFGSPYLACYALGGAILLLNFARSHCFTQAMLSQPKMESLDNAMAYCMGLVLLGVGTLFVLSSFFALGFTGTFLGDYFGILKEARVTTFPFSVLDNPMYWGSTANYLGWAIMHASPTGLLLTAVVGIVYVVAILYEEPFTAEIYRQKAAKSHKRN
ncbi:phosphatidylethanolamine N-methyltransferase isoform X1 [Loxodonta africana]